MNWAGGRISYEDRVLWEKFTLRQGSACRTGPAWSWLRPGQPFLSSSASITMMPLGPRMYVSL